MEWSLSGMKVGGYKNSLLLLLSSVAVFQRVCGQDRAFFVQHVRHASGHVMAYFCKCALAWVKHYGIVMSHHLPSMTAYDMFLWLG